MSIALSSKEKRDMNAENIEIIFKRFKKNNPNPQTELIYHSHFELLISVLLSAQATDVAVNKATALLYKEANTPESMRALGLEKLSALIKTIGLYHTKARHILATCAILIRDYQSQVPSTREALEQLPGVGRKTANVILNTAFGQPTIAVDTHIFRVANRTGLATGTTPLAVEQGLLSNIPEKYLKNAHHWLVLHGRYVCRAKQPQCRTCIIADRCQWQTREI